MVRPEHLARGVLSLFTVVVVATAGLAWRNTAHLQKADAAVTHSWQVLNSIERLLSTLKDVETGQRGYLLTADPAFLEPYEQATKGVRQRQDDLLVRVADEPEQVDRMRRLEPLVTQRVGEAARVLAIGHETGEQAAGARLREGRGKEYMDADRVLTAQMPSRRPGGSPCQPAPIPKRR